jgi:DNA-binding transcriptional LysR family regulator
MDLQHLRYFQAVARERGFTAASRSLGLSQSTVSEAVRRLEEDLGTTLFLRTRSGVLPTEAGLVLLERADAVLGLVERVADEIRDVQSGERGRFVLGCHDRLGSYFLPAFLRDFLREHPQIELELFTGSSADVRQAVIDREVHFGLVVNTAPYPDLVIVEAFRDVVQIFGSGPMPADLGDAVQLLRESVLAVPSRTPFDAIVERMAAQGLAPRQLLATGDLGLARSLAASGTALALLPWRVASDGPGLTALHPDLPSCEDRVHLVWRSDGHRTRAARTVRDAILSSARALPPIPRALAQAA